jgi:RecA-family ATPase
VSATIAPGGVGKSTNAIVEALAMVTGLPLPHRSALRIAPGKRLLVGYVNGEDPIEETQRHFQAAMLYFGIKPEDVESRLFIDSRHDQDFVFAREVDHRAFFGHSVAWLRERAMILGVAPL